MITTGRYQPPAGLLERLKTIDKHLGVLYGEQSKCWFITYEWPMNDPRREWVKKSAFPAERAYDTLCKLPKDCSVESAYGYFVRTVSRFKNADDRNRLLNRLAEDNQFQSKKNMSPVMELAEELIEVNKNTLFGSLGSTVIRSKAGARTGKNLDGKKLNDFLHDMGMK